MNALIIDDNPKTLVVLKDLLKAHWGTEAVFTAVQPYLVRSLMAAEQIDVVFIRVRLWDFRQFEELEQMPVVVFLSGGKDKLTMKEETAVRYALREPYNTTELPRLLRKIEEERFTEPPEYLFLRYLGRFHRVYFSEIELVEGKVGSYVQFFLKEGSQLLPGSLASWVRRLPADRFVRISDGLIVPATEIIKVKSNKYTFKDRQIRLSFRFASRAKKEMEHWPEGL